MSWKYIFTIYSDFVDLSYTVLSLFLFRNVLNFFVLFVLFSLLERHSCFHDPVSHVLLRWYHRRNPLLRSLLCFWEVQPLVRCRDHVLCFKWVTQYVESSELIQELILNIFISEINFSALIIVLFFLPSLNCSSLCVACNGHLHGSDRQLPGQAFWRLAILLVIHTRLGGTTHDLLCRLFCH